MQVCASHVFLLIGSLVSSFVELCSPVSPATLSACASKACNEGIYASVCTSVRDALAGISTAACVHGETAFMRIYTSSLSCFWRNQAGFSPPNQPPIPESLSVTADSQHLSCPRWPDGQCSAAPAPLGGPSQSLPSLSAGT